MVLEIDEHKVYIGDMCPSVKKDQLQTMFEKFGPIREIDFKYSKEKTPSKAYAFINFENPEDALAARTALNNTKINGRHVRVLACYSTESGFYKEENNVYMKYLDKQMTQKELYELCRDFGDIVSCKMATDERDNSKGHAFISYANEEDAKRCIKEMNGRQGEKRVIYAGPFIPKAKRGASEEPPPKNNIYVRNFDPKTTDNDLKDIFKKYGEIVSAVIVKDNEGKSRQFGFVCFKDPKDAQTALAELSGKEVNGRLLYLNWAQKLSERLKMFPFKETLQTNSNSDNRNLYIKNLDVSIDDSMLRSIFEPFGSIIRLKVALDENGNSKGFGFVCFSNYMEAMAAIMALNGSLILNRRIYVGVAQTKAERRAMLAARHQKGSSQQQQNAIPLNIPNNSQNLYGFTEHPNFVLPSPPARSISLIPRPLEQQRIYFPNIHAINQNMGSSYQM